MHGDDTHLIPAVSPALNSQSGQHHAPDTKAYIAEVCGTLSDGAHMGGGLNGQDAHSGRILAVEAGVARTLPGKANSSHDDTQEIYVTHSLTREGHDASEDGSGRATPIIAFDCKAGANTGFAIGEVPGALRGDGHGGGHAAIAFDTTQITSKANRSNPQPGDACHPITSEGHPPAIAFSCKDNGRDATAGVSPTLRGMGHSDSHANGGGQMAIAIGIDGEDIGFALRAGASHSGDKGDGGMNVTTVATRTAVRRLTPKECERLQGFPDDYTKISDKTADGPRYKALGNSMACNAMRWIGERIQTVDAI